MQTQHTDILIIGGGAVGCSIAYHLTRHSNREVVLLERYGLTQGATWHAAGLVGQLRGKRNLTRLMQYSAQLYGQLEAETGQATDWRAVGSLRVASSRERWQEIQRSATTARSFDFDLELISAQEAQDKFPLMTTDDVFGAAWIPGDGYIDPSSLTQAYAKGARARGVKILEGVAVTDIEVEGRRVKKVLTNQGQWTCDVLVNAAGLWAREVAALAGVLVPAGVVEHQYVITEKSAQVTPGLPTFRDPDKLFYIKPDVGSLAIGGWESDTLAFALDGMPEGFQRQLLPSNFDRFEQIMLQTAERLPILNKLGVQTLINGTIPVSPDGEPIMGPVPELDNFFVACGFTAGIAASGGAGKTMAEWILEGEPEYDVWSFDVRRFGPHHSSRHYLERRLVETYGRYYLIHWPHEELNSGRNLRSSPLHNTLQEQGAVFGAKFGWERANWFASKGTERKDSHAFDRTQCNDFNSVALEHTAVRESVALIDQSSFAKFEISGAGTLDALQHIAVSNLDQAIGTVIYTQLCNARGGIECDLTCMRLDEDHFHVVTGSGFGIHDGQWIRSQLARKLAGDSRIQVRDITREWAVINVCGPRARAVLEKNTASSMSNESFKYATCQWIELGAARVLAARIGYVGELGWELYTPVEYACHLYDLLWTAGREFNIRNAGYRAIDSLRMEKGYLYWSSDITPDYNPYEAGLADRVHLKNKGDFVGRAALEKIRAQGVNRQLCTFSVDGPAVFYGSECILHNDRVVGTTSSANYGHTLNTNIAYGYLAVELSGEEVFQIEAFGERYDAKRHDGPLYDPQMKRLKS